MSFPIVQHLRRWVETVNQIKTLYRQVYLIVTEILTYIFQSNKLTTNGALIWRKNWRKAKSDL
jgi:hypothetical protein